MPDSRVMRLLALAVAVTLAGCGPRGHGARARSGAASSAPGLVSSGPAPCRAGDLRGSVLRGGGVGQQTVEVRMALTPGRVGCVLTGVPRVELLAGSGKPLPVEQTAAALPAGDPVPLAAAGAAARVPVRWAPCPAGLPSAVALRVVLPKGGGGITLPLDPAAAAPCRGPVSVGPFLPA